MDDRSALPTHEASPEPPAVQVRPFEPRDRDAVVELVEKVLAEYGIRFGVGSSTDEQLRALPGSYRDHGGEFWIAEADGAVIGCVGMMPLPASEAGPGVAELRKMYLSPAARGKGSGKRLLQAAIAWAKAMGLRHIVLDTLNEMSSAIALYTGAGFVRDDAQIRAPRCSRGYRLDLS